MAVGWLSKLRDKAPGKKPALPTVAFDASRVTDGIKADLWAKVQELEDLPNGQQEAVYEAALRSVSRGRDLHVLAKALTEIGVPSARASEIAFYLNNRATSMMNIDRMLSVGITEAKWLYSGAPCYCKYPPTDADLRRDEAHKAANGNRFPLAKGLQTNDGWAYPGRELGCKCIANGIVPGFDV